MADGAARQGSQASGGSSRQDVAARVVAWVDRAAGPAVQGVDNQARRFPFSGRAVKAFLSALKAKDLDRLNEATALRAQVEASSSKNQELFKKIFDLSLSDSELDELAEKLEGYRSPARTPPRAPDASMSFLRKTGKNNGGYFLRKVTVRHEKKGWGVLDIAGAMEFKSMTSCHVAIRRSGESPATRAARRNRDRAQAIADHS